MKLTKRKWLLGKAKIKAGKDGLHIINDSPVHTVLVYPRVFKSKPAGRVYCTFRGEIVKGNAPILKMIDRRKNVLNTCVLNSVNVLSTEDVRYYFIILYIPENSECHISELVMEEGKEADFFEGMTSDTLVVTPGYPAVDNKYNCAFVHTRVRAYQKVGMNVDVACICETLSAQSYEFEGVKVVRAGFGYLRELLMRKKYGKILIHFFDNRFANVLESVDLSDTKLYFYLHGAETLYHDWTKILSPYFGPPAEITDGLRQLFAEKDFFIKKYNHIKCAKWIFVTPWTRSRCEELLGIKFENSDVIPCLIDTELFSYQKKDPELRKKIFVLRKFDDINSYSLDTVVRVIEELSRRDFFSDLEFDIYGDGSLHSVILEPVTRYPNVHIHKRFLTHEEIRRVHETHGIALFPTRFDSQAVSSCEAASSGCAVVTSDIPGVRQFIPHDLGVLCEVENPVSYADVIEKMYRDPGYFALVAEKESESVRSKYDFEHTIGKELAMYEADEAEPPVDRRVLPAGDPVVSVIIPAYNVEKYLGGTVYSILDCKNASKVELLIVNDGSKDGTLGKALELRDKYAADGKSVIRVIDKENGGHGSTINRGIEEARGKYIKVIDGDDTVDSEVFSELVDILETEDSDVVLNNYIEDRAPTNERIVKKLYDHLKPGIKYKFDDLCYDAYGFTSWGPILSCSSYKTEMLRRGNFKLTEKHFYVDMELNINVAVLCDTVTYYDLDVYRYLLGRSGQSITRASYTRNYKHHEDVCLNMIAVYEKHRETLSEDKRRYIEDKLIAPMLNAQYDICIEYFRKGSPFREYDKRLKEHPYFYNFKPEVKTRRVTFHRLTKGIFIKFMSNY